MSCGKQRDFSRFRLSLRLASFSILFAGLCIWLFHGANTGFWKTSVETRVEVPVVPGMPELGVQEKIEWEERFVSGIETPLVSLVLALCMWSLSMRFSSSKKPQSTLVNEQ